MDFILNGQANGDLASRLLACNFNPNAMRPYIEDDRNSPYYGRHCFTTVNAAGEAVVVPLANANATLRKEEWKYLDAAIIKAARPRLRAVADLRGAGLELNIPNGLGKTILETEDMGDINPARISMDGLDETDGDRPVFGLRGLPLPVIHKDFHFSLRQLAPSRGGSTPLDTSMAEASARTVAEEAEKLLIGTADSFSYGGSTVYGYKNFPNRIKKLVTAPTASGWTPATLIKEVGAMIQASINAYHYGPWMLYYGTSWSLYMNDEYKAESDNTLAQRLRKIENLRDVRSLDYLTGYDLILVQQTSDVAREVVGMDITTVQWESHGGMKINFKVMAIMVPQLRTDHNGTTGLVHAAVSQD